MAASLFDSPMYVTSFPAGEASRLFTDSAAVRAVLLVEGTLAKVQGELGLIPEDSALFIHRSSMEVLIDPAGLAKDMATGGFAPAVANAFVKAMEASELSKFIHYEVEPEDVEMAALSLRLRQFLSHCEKKIGQLDQDRVDVTAIQSALGEARLASVGLYIGSAPAVTQALADALRMPVKEQRVDPTAVALAAKVICAEIAKSDAGNLRLAKLKTYCAGLTEMLVNDPVDMHTFCLSQTCLCAAASLEIANG